MRRVLFQVHVWVGVCLGLYLAVIGVSGSILVFRDEIEEWLHPEIFHVRGDGGGHAPALPVLMASAKRAFPDRQLTAVYGPTHERQSYVAYMQRRSDGDVLYAYLHPVTAELVGSSSASTSVIHWLQDLHFNLFNGRSGRTVNSTGALFLLALCVTGLVIWRGGFAISLRRRSWKRINWDLHSAVGFWGSLVLGVWALTGFYFGYSASVMALLNRISPLSQVAAPESVGRGTGTLDFDGLVLKAQSLSPGNAFFGLQLPAGKRGAVIVFLSRTVPAVKGQCDYVYFDQYTGEHLKTWSRGVSRSTGDAIVNSVVPVHFGTFGGWPIRVLWSVLGMAPAVLFASGFVMWWNRVLGPWRRQRVRPAADVELAV
jgi:uncharacterized iron-regulated membrane protein